MSIDDHRISPQPGPGGSPDPLAAGALASSGASPHPGGTPAAGTVDATPDAPAVREETVAHRTPTSEGGSPDDTVTVTRDPGAGADERGSVANRETATTDAEAPDTASPPRDPQEPDKAAVVGGAASPSGGADKPAPPAAPADGKPADWENFAPPAPPPVRPAGRARRTLDAVGSFLGHEWTLACLAGLALAAVMFWPAVVHPASTITADVWDPTLQTWQVAWSGHILATDPGQLWNSNSFYPDQHSFAFSDTLLGYFPIGLIGHGPVAAIVRYNALFVLLMALCFIGGYALARQLGAGRLGGAVAAVAVSYAPWRWSQAGHMHVMSMGGILLALAMLARGHGFSFRDGWRTERGRPGWALAGWLVAAWQLSLSFGIGIPFAYVLGAAGLVAVLTWLRRGRPRLGRRLVAFDALGIVVFGAVAAFMARPFFEVVKLHPEAKRSIEDVAIFSPNLRSFLTAPGQSWLWGDLHEQARSTMIAPAETCLLAGFALYGLAVAGLFFSTWKVRTRLWLLLGVLVSGYLSLGTHVPAGRQVGYVLLYKYAPGWNAIRTPGRVFLWTTLFLALLAAGAVAELAARSRELAEQTTGGRPTALARLALILPLFAVTVEGVNSIDHPDVPVQPAAMRTVDGPLMVLPSDQTSDEIIMLWSTTKFQKMVNGGSGFTPTDQWHLREQTKSFPDANSVAALRAAGVKTVVVLRNPPPTLVNNDYTYAQNPDDPIDGLGISRTVDADTIIYTLN
jgi:hypothetical protein